MNFNIKHCVSAIVLATLVGCGGTPNDSAKKSEMTKAKDAMPVADSLLTKRPKTNLLNYANPGFEKPVDGVVVKARDDKGQVNLAQFDVIEEAALTGKKGLAAILENGGLKLSYGIWRLKSQFDPKKQYRFEFDARLGKSEAVLFTKVSDSPWQRSAFVNTPKWQTVGTTIDGAFLAQGKPIHVHIDNIKDKEFAVVFVDNIRLYPVN